MIKKYYINLINRIFNVLYIYETNISIFDEYVESLVFELSGNDDFEEIQQIKFKLNALLKNEVSHKDVRRVVLKSVNILDRLLSNWEV